MSRTGPRNPSVRRKIVRRLGAIKNTPEPQVDRDSGSGCVRYIIRTTPNRQPIFYEQDELPLQVVTFGVDEDYFQLPGVQLFPSSRFVVPDVDENHGAPLGGFRLDEDWMLTGAVSLYTNQQPIFTDEDLSPPIAALYLDEDWLLTGAVPLWKSPQPEPVDEELGFPVVSFYLDEDWMLTGAVPLIANRQPWFDNEVWPTPPVAFGLEDEYYFEPLTVRYIVNPGAAFATKDDNDAWVPFVPPVTPDASIYKPTWRPRRGR